MEIREASINDWELLHEFFIKFYRDGHPLHQKYFWEWQYGDPQFGRSFICLNAFGAIVGHIGANFGGGLAWIINVYLEKDYRSKGILRKLYALAREYYPLAATSANKAGLGLYKKMGWIRYYDLIRYVKINPIIRSRSLNNVCKNINVSIDNIITKEEHYLRQPSIIGIKLNGSSQAVSQTNVGGLRVISFERAKALEENAWDLGYLWMDYLTSWNDLKTNNLEKNGWVPDYNTVVPWRLNPIVENYYCKISFLSEMPLDPNFVVNRSYSDHGRIGSL